MPRVADPRRLTARDLLPPRTQRGSSSRGVALAVIARSTIRPLLLRRPDEPAAEKAADFGVVPDSDGDHVFAGLHLAGDVQVHLLGFGALPPEQPGAVADEGAVDPDPAFVDHAAEIQAER